MGADMQIANTLFPILGLAMWLLIWSSICRHLQKCFQGIPHEYRKLRPGLVWLLLIPGINVVWIFVAFTALFSSYQSYLRDTGRYKFAIFDQIIAITFGCVSAYVAIADFLEPDQMTRWGYWAIVCMAMLIVILVRTSRLQKQVQAATVLPSPVPSLKQSADD